MKTMSMKTLAKNLEGRPDNIFRILLNRLTRHQQHELLITTQSRDIRIRIFRFSRHQDHLAHRLGVKILSDLIRGKEPFLIPLELLPPTRINKLLRKSCLRKQFTPAQQKVRVRQWLELIAKVKPEHAAKLYNCVGPALYRAAFDSMTITGSQWEALAQHHLSFDMVSSMVHHDPLLEEVVQILVQYRHAAFERLIFILGGEEFERRVRQWRIS